MRSRWRWRWWFPALLLPIWLPLLPFLPPVDVPATYYNLAVSTVCHVNAEKAYSTPDASAEDEQIACQGACVINHVPALASMPNSSKWMLVTAWYCNNKLDHFIPSDNQDALSVAFRYGVTKACEAAALIDLRNRPWPEE